MEKDEYYEEKQIGLTTYYRLHPAFDWREMSNKDLTKKINELQAELKRVKAELSSVPQANELLPHVSGSSLFVIELSDDELQIVTKNELDEMYKSAMEFDGFLGFMIKGRLV